MCHEIVSEGYLLLARSRNIQETSSGCVETSVEKGLIIPISISDVDNVEKSPHFST
jgi:hypothetical protein